MKQQEVGLEDTGYGPEQSGQLFCHFAASQPQRSFNVFCALAGSVIARD